MPVSYAWDDHDWGGNDSTASAASAPARWQVYREMFATPSMLNEAEAIYRSWVASGVRFIHLDTKSRLVPGTTVLGATQLAWFKAELTAAKAAGEEDGDEEEKAALTGSGNR